ncbi:MAG: hypothetical protein DWQ37_06580 [Planctomycetota bacterium]|nr:MAG: hypothetical protein DWQ37_06580 [Planctomycetota bacterium]
MNVVQLQVVLLDAASAVSEFAVNWLVQSTILLSVGLVTGRLLARRGSAVQSAVYRTTLVAVILCPAASLALALVGASGWSIALPRTWSYGSTARVEADTPPFDDARPALQPPAAETALAETPPVAPLSQPEFAAAPPFASEDALAALPASAEGLEPLPEEAALAPAVAVQPPVEPAPVEAQGTPTVTVHGVGIAVAVAGALWLLLCAGWLARLAMAWWRLTALRRRALPAEAGIRAICRELAERLGVAAPGVLRSPYLPSPCLAGLRRPVVLLPDAELSLSPRDVLIHELAHLVRRDCHWNLLRQLALAVFFFQPLLWVLSRRLEATAEEVCDDYVVQYGGDRQQYASRLVEIAELSIAPVASAGVGIVSLHSMLGQRVQRILDTSRSLSTRVGSLLLALMLAVALAGTTIVGLVGIGPRESVAETLAADDDGDGADANQQSDNSQQQDSAGDPVEASRTDGDADAAHSAVTTTDDQSVTIRGRVLDADGNPVPEASVRVVRWFWNPDVAHRPLSETRSDSQGRFEIAYSKSQFEVDVRRPEQWKEVAIAAIKPGHGPDWVWLNRLPLDEPLELRLAGDGVPIAGRVLDLEGRPLAGVHIKPGTIQTPLGDDLSDWIEAVKQGEPPWTAANRLRRSGLPWEGTGLADELTTDADGRFVLRGIGAERTVSLEFTGPTVARTAAIVATRRMAPTTQRRTNTNDGDQIPVLGADFELALPPARVIEGVVRDAETGQPLAGKITVRGRVLGPDGKPVAGATVYAAWILTPFVKYPSTHFDYMIVAQDKSDEAGNYELSMSTDHPDRSRATLGWQVAAFAPGMAPAWQTDMRVRENVKAGQPTNLTLSGAQSIRGRVVDLEGNPISGVAVRIYKLHRPKGADALLPWLKEAKEKAPPANVHDYYEADNNAGPSPYAGAYPAEWGDRFLVNGSPALPAETVTDENGWFQLSGLGTDQLAILGLESPEIAKCYAHVVVRDMAPVFAKPSEPMGLRAGVYFGQEFQFVAEPTQPISGTVTDADSGEPLADVEVRAQRFAGNRFSQQDFLTTRTDKDGHYTLIGAPAGGGHDIEVSPSLEEPYFPTAKELPKAPGIVPLTLDFALHRGQWIVGKVSNEQTGEGIKNAVVEYLPLRDNAFAKDYPNYRPRTSAKIPSERNRSSDDGSFRVLAIPGPGILAAIAPNDDRKLYSPMTRELVPEHLVQDNGYLKTYHPWVVTGYHAVREVELADSVDDTKVDLQLTKGLSSTIKLVDADGRPVQGVQVLGRNAPPSLEGPLDESTIDVIGLRPDETREVVFVHADRRLGATVNVSAGDEMTVELEPCALARGRVVDEEGGPVAELRVTVTVESSDTWARPLVGTTTDKEGRFEAVLPPGVTCRIWHFSRGGSGVFSAECRAQSGRVFELGELPKDTKLTVEQTEKRIAASREDEPSEAATASEKTVPSRTTASPAPEGEPSDAVVADEADGLWEFAGRVVGPEGKPVAGASLAILHWGPDQFTVAATATTAADGTFTLRISGDDSQWDQLMVTAEGFGLAWERAAPFETSGELLKALASHRNYKHYTGLAKDRTLRLVADTPIRGRVVNLEGQGVPGAVVHVSAVHGNRADGLDPWLSAVESGGLGWNEAWRHLPDSLFVPNHAAGGANVLPRAVTDAEGHFRLSGLGSDRLIGLVIAAEGFETRPVWTRTRAGETLQIAFRASDPGGYQETLYSPQFDYAAAPSRPVTGVVRDAETGQPMAGITVAPELIAGRRVHGVRSNDFIQATTDAQGRYRLEGLPIGTSEIAAVPPRNQPYLGTVLEVTSQPTQETTTLDLQVKRGVWIRGRVTDGDTGEPVRGYVQYFAFDDNPNTLAVPGLMRLVLHSTLADADGRYQIVGLPGRGLLTLLETSADDRYPRGAGAEAIDGRGEGTRKRFRTLPHRMSAVNAHYLADVNPDTSAEAIEHNIELHAGSQIAGTVLDDKGNPLSGAQCAGLTNISYWNDLESEHFVVRHIEHGQKRRVYFYHEAKNLAGSVEVSGDSRAPLTVRLQPAGVITGRVFLETGNPAERVQLVQLSGGGDDNAENEPRGILPGRRQFLTDDEGRFELTGLAPGLSYNVSVARGSSILGNAFDAVTVAAGETKDLGDLVLGDSTSEEETKKTTAKSAEKPSNATAGFELAGKVVDATGKPVSAARVYLLQDVPTVSEPILMARTKADGTFAFRVAKNQFSTEESNEPWLTAKLVAMAQGRGLAWALAASFEPSGNLLERLPPHPNLSDRRDEVASDKTLHLAADEVPIEGRIIDLEGRPVAGARVRVIEIRRPAGANLDAWLAAVRDETRAFDEPAKLVSTGFNFRRQLEPFFPDVVTGADGRFRLRGVGGERIALLQIEGAGIETRQISARTRNGATIRVVDPRFPEYRGQTYHGAAFEEVMGPSRPVQGVVRDKDTGQPLSGARVEAYRLAGVGVQPYPNTLFFTHADQEGRYELRGLPVGENELLAQGPRSAPYLVSALAAKIDPGSEATTVDFQLKRGHWIRGRVTDALSGEPLRGTVKYYAFSDNPHLGEAPGFSDAFALWFPTDADGRYEIAGLPGRGIVGVRASNYSDYPIGVGADRIEGRLDNTDSVLFRTAPSFCSAANFHALAVVNPAEGDESRSCDFALVPGRSVSGTVLDPQGEPLAGALFAGGVERQVWQPLAGATFKVANLQPDRARRIQFYHAERRLAGTHVVDGEQRAPLTVKLEPWATITGRIVDAQGDAVGAVRVSSRGADDPRYGILPKRYAYQTDSDGRFTMEGLAPGIPYRLGATKASRFLGTVAQDLTVAAGETKDLGDLVLGDSTSEEETKKTTAKSAEKPAAPSTTVAGRVTLGDGRPAAGAHVAVKATLIKARRGGHLPARGDVLAEGTTDADGNYRLDIGDASSKTHRNASLIARQDGHAIAWRQIDLDAEHTDASLELPPEERIRGKLVDIEGQPAGKVRLGAWSVMRRATNGRASPDGVGFRGTPDGSGNPAAWLPVVTSDNEGHFTVHGVPADYGVFLKVDGSDRFAPQDVALNTGLPEQRGERDATYRPLVKNVASGEEAVLALAPAQLFEGQITYADTGQPASGARLNIWASQQEQFGSMSSVAGQADETGHYRISPEPGVRFGLVVYPPAGVAYLPRRTPRDQAIRWKAGDRVKRVDVELTRGVLVRGRIVEETSGQPVAGASIQYEPESSNNPNETDEILTGWQGIQLSDDEGRFEIAVLPGPGRILVHGPESRYVLRETSEREVSRGKPGGRRRYAHAIERIEPAAGDEPLELSIAIREGATLTGTVVDTSGSPVDEVLVISRLHIAPTSYSWSGHTTPTLGGNFELTGLDPAAEYPIYFLDAKRKLGATRVVRADMQDPTVVLEPCGEVSARFVDSAGQPVEGFEPGPYMIVTPGVHEFSDETGQGALAADADFVANIDRVNYQQPIQTDADGRVTYPALIPGATYRLSTYKDGKPVMFKEFTVSSGEKLDLGEFTFDLDP